MKTKVYVLAALLMASMTNLRADEEISLYSSGEGHSIGYKGNKGLFIGHTSFSGNSAVAGNIVRIGGTKTGADHKFFVGEFAEDNEDATVHLPGSDYRNLPNEPSSFTFDMYLTEDMLQRIITNEEDFRIYGEGITISSVKLVKPGKADALKFGKTIWTGYFWMDDSWSLEIFKEAFTVMTNEEFAKYGIMRIYYEANRTDFLMRLFTKFGAISDEYADEDDIKLASSETTDDHMGVHAGGVIPKRIYLTPTYVDIPLTETIKTYLRTKDVDHGTSLLIKCNKNGAAFNVTDVVLLPISPDGCDNCFYVY